MDNSPDQLSQRRERAVLVPTYIENLNAVARAHGLRVSEVRIAREQILQGDRTKKTIERLAVDWRGSGAQLRSLGWILPSWSFPVATVRGPGYKRLEAKWGIRGYVRVPKDESEVIFEIDHGAVPLRAVLAGGVETITYEEYIEHHGSKASLIASGIADANQLSGKKQTKSNGRSPIDRSWWRLLQHDETIIFGVETDLARRRRKREEEDQERHYVAACNRSVARCAPDEVTKYGSVAQWKGSLSGKLDLISTARNLAFKHMDKTAEQFRLDVASAARLDEILTRVQAEISALIDSATVSDLSRSHLRLVVDNAPSLNKRPSLATVSNVVLDDTE